MGSQYTAKLACSRNLRNIKHHGFVVTMVRTGTLMNQDTFELISVFLISRLLITKKFVHIKHDRKGNVVFPLLPLESRNIKDKAK